MTMPDSLPSSYATIAHKEPIPSDQSSAGSSKDSGQKTDPSADEKSQASSRASSVGPAAASEATSNAFKAPNNEISMTWREYKRIREALEKDKPPTDLIPEPNSHYWHRTVNDVYKNWRGRGKHASKSRFQIGKLLQVAYDAQEAARKRP
jgi:hypothetical protein